MPPKRSKTPKKAAVPITYSVNQLVFAKLKGWAPWPGRVEEVNPLSAGLQYRIFFYGSHNFGFCKAEEMGLFDELKDTLGKNRKAKDYQAAMKEALDTPMMAAPNFNPKPEPESEVEEEEEKEEEEEDEDLKPPPKKKARVAQRISKGKPTTTTPKASAQKTKEKRSSTTNTNGLMYELHPHGTEEDEEEEKEDDDNDDDSIVDKPSPKPVKKQPNVPKKKTVPPLRVRVSGLRKPTWKQDMDKSKSTPTTEVIEEPEEGDTVEKMETDADVSKNDESSNVKETENSNSEAESEAGDLDDEKSPEYSDLDDSPKKEKIFNVSLHKDELSLLLEHEKLDDTVRDQLKEKSEGNEEDDDGADVEDNKDNSSDQENDEKPITAETIESIANQNSFEEAKSFFRKELELVETVDKLQQAIPSREIPDFVKAISVLDDLKKLPFHPFMFYKNAGITKTLFQLRCYFGPEDTRRLTSKEEDFCEIFRNKSHRLLLSYLDAMKAPTSVKQFNRFFHAKMGKILKAKQDLSLIELISDPTEDDLEEVDLINDTRNEEQGDPEISDDDFNSKKDDDETDQEAESDAQHEQNLEDDSNVSDRVPLKPIESNEQSP